ncbi:SLBB domain-containing protein [Salmonirosea aquatica]|uniref:Polysaccharide export protein n=1 Tax=Salmonirosea aquatica TaxID=2654236 RepID=A0A7C9FZJ4_9BACT|nr:polysaccharide export protein [Cytophagaceae bacterium SJW1-29]
MILNSPAIYQKNLLLALVVFCIALSPVFSQVTTPAPTGAPSTSGTGASTTSRPGNASSQSNTNTPTNPNAPQTSANTPQTTANAQTDVNPQDAKSQAEAALKAADQEKTENEKNAASVVDQKKQELRDKIFGFDVFANKQYEPISGKSIATPSDYTIGPGDALTLYINGYAELPTQDLIVNRDGFISLIRVGNVNVGGKSIEEAQKILLSRYSKYIPSLLGSGGNSAPTKLTLTLSQTREVNVFVTGEVINPGSYSLTSLSSAFDALYQSGGPNEIGTFREVKVIRNNKVVSTFDIYPFLTSGTLEGAIRVQDNDRITVGYYKKRVELIGNVKRPGLYEPKEGEVLSDIIGYAGGFTDIAYRGQVKVYRITPRERRILDVYSDQFDKFVLETGDEIEVETVLDRFENIVTIEGAVMRPGEYSIDNNPSLKVLIEHAQGLREDAFTGRIYVSRTRADQSVENIPLNLADIINGTAEDLLLTRLDKVTIPSRFDLAEQSSVHIQGEVNNPKIGDNGGNFAYMTNMTLEDVILMAGGFKESAKASQVEVVRRVRNSDPQASDASISQTFRFDVNRDLSLNGKDSGFPLMPFDEIIVRKSPNYQEQQFITLDGEFLNPGEYGIESKNEKITDLIDRSGGLTNLAYVKGATLIRRTPVSDFETQQTATALNQIQNDLKKGAVTTNAEAGVRQEYINIRLDKILKNPNSNDNIIVQQGDILRVPKRLETVQVKGELLYPTTVKYDESMSFLDFISQSGGFTRQSLKRSSFVKYPNGSVDRTRKFLVFNVYPKVEPGSEIYVPSKVGNELTTQQILQQGISITSTLFTLILSVLAFRTIR